MGGREVGGLANQLAAHIDFSDADAIQLVADFWQTGNIARREGLKAIDMFSAVHRGDIKAIWIMGTNPAVSMPDNNLIKEALQNCPMVVVSDCIEHTDTGVYANVLLPATGWGEKDGTVTNSERTISRQRQFLTPPEQARHDWQIICDVACRLGFADAFSFGSQAEIFSEHATLSGFRNAASEKYRLFNISGLAGLSQSEYDSLSPRQWPVMTDEAACENNLSDNNKRLLTGGRFVTASQRARLISITPQMPQASVSAEFPFLLNTGRIRDQWHTMTRTAKAPQLLTHTDEPFISLHPDDAATLELGYRSLAVISNRYGHCIVKVDLNDDQQPGQAFMPIHWNRQYAAQASVCSLFPAYSDPLSGQPELKQAAVSIEPFDAAWYGTLICSQEPEQLPCEYWSKIPCEHGYRYMLAGSQQPQDWSRWLEQNMSVNSDRITVSSANGEHFRLASFSDDYPRVVFITAPTPPGINHQWLEQQLATAQKSGQERQMLLAGRPATPEKPKGKILCSCFQVGKTAFRKPWRRVVPALKS
ncbi:molybdopterin oxidoreductase family protein [Aliamphritea spongicola]